MNNFDIIYYINLDERPDRKDHFLQQCQLFNINPDKIKRISAIKHQIPYLGCSLSHLKCLQDFELNEYKNCVIFEDDFVFKENKELTNFILNKFFDSHIQWDVVMLSAYDLQVKTSTIPYLYKAIDVQTASGYAINRHFLPIIKNNFDEGLRLLTEHDQGIYCVDQYWKRLQPLYNWYVFSPKLGYQKDDFSNIENRMVSYRDKYDTRLPYNYKFIMGVLTCQNNLHMAYKQYQNNLINIHEYPIIYTKFMGNPNLETPWSYNEKENLLIIRCEDDYLNLPNKVYLFLKISKQLFPNMLGVFKTDEDIDINLPNLYKMLEDNKQIPYYGKFVNGSAYYSNYLSSKTYVTDVYPEFKKYNVKVEFGAYCSGGGYFINQNCIKIILENEQYFKPFPKDNYNDYLVRITEYIIANNVMENIHFNNLNVFEDKTIGVVLNKYNIIPIDKIHELIKAVHWDGI